MKNFIKKGGVYHHKSGLFRVRERKGRNMEIQFTNIPGLWESAGTKDLYEAEEYANNRLMHRCTPTGTKKHDITFGEFAKNFFIRRDSDSFNARKEAFGKIYKPSFYSANQSRLDNHLMPYLKDCPLALITSADLEDIYLASSFTTDKDKSLSDNTKNKIRQTAIYIFSEAMRLKLIDKNPCDETERITERGARRDIFSKEEMAMLFPKDRKELERIWQNENNSSDGSALLFATYFSVMYDTGFRPGEVSGLGKSNFKGNGVYTTKSVDGVTRTLVNSIKTTSKGQPFKVGILSDYTLDLVHELIDKTEGEYLFKVDGRWMLCNTANKHLTASLKRAGIEPNGRTQYCFRHTFNTNLRNSLNDDVKEKDIDFLMGHTSYRREYDHRNGENIIEALDKKVKGLVNEMRG